jgi:hypothetical protein
MHHKGQESSSRKLVWVEGQGVVGGWGCSECAWVFNPSGPPTGKTLDEMKRNFQVQLSEEFGSQGLTPSDKDQLFWRTERSGWHSVRRPLMNKTPSNWRS